MTGDFTHYTYMIAETEDELPPNLWTEARFRSNRPFSAGGSLGHDGRMASNYRTVTAAFWMHGDLISDGGAVSGLPVDEFYTVRFEYIGGVLAWGYVNGIPFGAWFVAQGEEYYVYIQIRGEGGWNGPAPGFTKNEWDFVRYGTVSFGERIIAADPPAGFLSAVERPAVDRFTVRYDSPNYAYVDDITVSAEGGSAGDTPRVIETKRLDNGPSDVLEIVLDRPLPLDARTVFTFHENNPDPTAPETVNAVAYTYQRGDLNADGQWNLTDFAALQGCFFRNALLPPCNAFDYDANGLILPPDYAAFVGDFINSGP
jgi:hypothetical protein